MTHSCPDGTHTKLVRDGAAPIGQDADLTCPRCGYVFDAAERDRAALVLASFAASHRGPSLFVRRALASELPAKDLGR